MFQKLKNLFQSSPRGPKPALPKGQRAYAIGDIHGRSDLFGALIAAIEADDRQRGYAAGHTTTTVILLGDLVDRGPDSAGVLRLAREWQRRRPVRILMGNHEEMLLGAMDDIDVLRVLLRHGGEETILSFGVERQAFLAADYEAAQAMLQAAVDAETAEFIRAFENRIHLGDYCFVHAGIRPGIALEEQSVQDLRWIREPFLSCEDGHGAVIVHGHTICGDVQVGHNRIGIDTGAYQSHQLTALGLEGESRWLIGTGMDGSTVQTWIRHAI